MKLIKILHLIPTLSSGGAEQQLMTVVNNTSKEKFKHVVCVINNADFFAPDIRQAGSKVIELKISAKRPFLQVARKFRHIIKQEKPDIIHTRLHDASIAARLAVMGNWRIPLITSLEAPDYDPEIIRVGNWNPRKMKALKIIDKATSLLANQYFVPCSEHVKRSYQQHYGLNEQKTQVIYNSVNPTALACSVREVENLHTELALPKNAFVYVSVGRLDPQKNHRLMIFAFKQILPEIPHAFLLLAGAGSLEHELKKIVENLSISDRVVFLGRRSDVGALLGAADVFLFPSLFEGLGVALIEAMFKYLPCIASRIDVLEEVITDGETGLMINPTSTVDLQNAMIRLYKNKKLRKSLGVNAYNQAKLKFSTDVIVNQWEDFYQKIMTADRQG